MPAGEAGGGRGEDQRGAASQREEDTLGTNTLILFQVILRLARFPRLNWLLKAAARTFLSFSAKCERTQRDRPGNPRVSNGKPGPRTASRRASVCWKTPLNNYCVCRCRRQHVPAHISPGNKPAKSGYCKAPNGFHGAIKLFGLFQSVTEHHPPNTGEQMLIKVCSRSFKRAPLIRKSCRRGMNHSRKTVWKGRLAAGRLGAGLRSCRAHAGVALPREPSFVLPTAPPPAGPIFPAGSWFSEWAAGEQGSRGAHQLSDSVFHPSSDAGTKERMFDNSHDGAARGQ